MSHGESHRIWSMRIQGHPLGIRPRSVTSCCKLVSPPRFRKRIGQVSPSLSKVGARSRSIEVASDQNQNLTSIRIDKITNIQVFSPSTRSEPLLKAISSVRIELSRIASCTPRQDHRVDRPEVRRRLQSWILDFGGFQQWWKQKRRKCHHHSE